MSLSPELRDRITALVQSNSVLLFMKGNRRQPQCGFSARVVGEHWGPVPQDGKVPTEKRSLMLAPPGSRRGCGAKRRQLR